MHDSYRDIGGSQTLEARIISFHDVLLNAKKKIIIKKMTKSPQDSAPVAAVKTGISMRRTINQKVVILFGGGEKRLQKTTARSGV